MKNLNNLIDNYDINTDKSLYYNRESKLKSVKSVDDFVEFLNNSTFGFTDNRQNFHSEFKKENLDEDILEQLNRFLDESVKLEDRWNNELNNQGMGAALKSEILCYMYPDKYPFILSPILNSVNEIYNTDYQLKSMSVTKYIEITKKLRHFLKGLQSRFPDANMYDVNEILWNLKDYNTSEIESINSSSVTEDKNVFDSLDLIIHGVPGSGKSFYINRLLKDKDYERVVFYPDYSYSDFVGTYKISNNGKIVLTPGPFSRMLDKALIDDKHCHYLIIEEMSRGNAEAIFGDVFQLIDRSNIGDRYSINSDIIYDSLSEAAQKKLIDKKIYIPDNLILVSTINTSDQNVFNLDTAFS